MGKQKFGAGVVRGVIAAFVILSPLIYAGCAFFPPPKSVIPLRSLVVEPVGRASELVVFLPGRRNKPEEFEKNGFIALARERCRVGGWRARLANVAQRFL